jgi:hypothetical protein
MYGLGRFAAPDARDRRHLLAAALPTEAPLPRYRNYNPGPVMDQGQTSQCVGFAWRAFLHAAPLQTKSGPDAPTIYYGAQRLDEWPGEDYEGSSVRGGAKFLQRLDHLESYLWAFNIHDVERWLLGGHGTLVLGTNWYEGMFDPDRDGRLRLTGRIAGGHAYLAYGCNRQKGIIRVQNSWGTPWGVSGRAYLTYDDLARLLSEDGEACTAREQRKKG